VLGCAVLILPGMGATSIERAEIYFLDGARAMVEGGDWLVPHYRGEAFFDKPPLTYWLIAAAFRAFGFTTTAARLVPAAAAILVALATVWLGTLLFDRRAAFAAGGALATTFGFMTFGRVAMSDMLLALWSTLAFALAVRLYRGGAPPWMLPALGAVLGLGFATKGPVAVLLPGLGILVLAWTRPIPRLEPPGVALAGLAFAVLGLGWFAAVYARLGMAPLEHFFLRENVERFAAETYDSGRSPWFYLGTYLAEGAPWSLFLPLALRRAWRPSPSDQATTSNTRLLFGWIALALVPLSLSRGKIDYYLLPLYPAASLLLAQVFTLPRSDRLERLWVRGALVLEAAILAFLPVVIGRVPPPWLGSEARVVCGAACAVAAAALLLAAMRPRPVAVLATVGAVSGGLFLLAATLLVPAFVSAQPNAALVAEVLRERAFRPDVSVASCSDPTRVGRDLLFHARLAVLERCDLWNPASADQPFLLLLQRNEKDSLRTLRQFRMVAGHDYLESAAVNLERLLAPLRPGVLFLAANYPSTDPAVLEEARRHRARFERVQEKMRGAAGTIPE
jgi:4-amino-4-deoxy-L-arabinose transferase-like glycosyltransferase